MKWKYILIAGVLCLFVNPTLAQWTDNGSNITTDDKVGINLSIPAEVFHVDGAGYFHHGIGAIKIEAVRNEQANNYVRSSILSSRDGDLEWDANTDQWTLGSGDHNDFVAILHNSHGRLGFFTGDANAFQSLSNTDFRDQFQRMTIIGNGNVGIGTRTPSSKLAVNGIIRSKEVTVENADWPDYVFNEDYRMPDLEELESFIKKNKHLPGIPTQKNVKREGQRLGIIQSKLLEKIEELTLHVIELKKEIKKLESNLEEEK